MNREQAKKLLPILAAFAEGKEIQFKSKGGVSWVNTGSPLWNFTDYEYRVKPEPVEVERWACVQTSDSTICTFISEQGAREFASMHIPGSWVVFVLRGKYEC